jgi:hypothetical protein
LQPRDRFGAELSAASQGCFMAKVTIQLKKFHRLKNVQPAI